MLVGVSHLQQGGEGARVEVQQKLVRCWRKSAYESIDTSISTLQSRNRASAQAHSISLSGSQGPRVRPAPQPAQAPVPQCLDNQP